MLDYTKEDLLELGAEITTREIYQQPDVWKEAFESYQARRDEIAAFLQGIADKHDYIKVILTGAGTSAYVGDTLVPYFKEVYDERKWNFNSIATTDIVANPQTYLKKDVATVLVSFARSGNSPESVATVDLAKALVDELYQVTITCAAEGKLALQAHGDDRNLLLLQPAASNDAGFAMTSSFTSMMLTALLVFDPTEFALKAERFEVLSSLARKVLENVADVKELVDLDFNRVIYLGAGPFFGLAHEAQLKILELTAGQVATMYESPVGFRHGPKSLINEDTVVLVFGTTTDYTRKYDLDLVREVAGDQIARRVVLLSDQAFGLENVKEVALGCGGVLNDIYRVFPYIVYAQLFALLTSLKVENKRACLQKLSDENGIISALAFDQRGALKRLMAQYQTEEPTVAQMEELKVLVADELTKYASSMLLDPEYGLPATKALDPKAGLLLAYEKTGYDTTSTKRLPDCLDVWSAKRIKEQGADAVKFLLYYDVDSSDELNQEKQAYIERIGSECVAEDIPFFLEILAYDENIADAGSAEYAKVKPHKVIGAMKVFSDPRFNIDVLKVEVPVNVKYVEGFGDGEIVHTREEAATFFKAQDEATNLPYIYLSAGVSAKLFQETLVFAHESGANFNGVLCGRATWAGSVEAYIKDGEAAAREWLRTTGFENIDELNKVLQTTATSWTERVEA